MFFPTRTRPSASPAPDKRARVRELYGRRQPYSSRDMLMARENRSLDVLPISSEISSAVWA
ncbi:hypothetical protein SAMN04489726_7618 [Allokutzneria albata]|uniref:Uncharacterized protein n=1 Tax=Allokutzneria albata TaxID=211114 RepID=A0A1H0D6J9_ALLAB|nr:hypothetical protein SAMN04489726_7618 [Allokutzneria albata]